MPAMETLITGVEDPVLKLVGIEKSYKEGSGTLPILRGCDFNLFAGELTALVAPSGSCVAMTTHFYDVLFEHDPLYRQRAAILASVTFELTEFLVDVLHVTDLGAHFAGKLTYHASCHLLRELGVDRQPRALLEQVAGAEQVPLVGTDECCGFGGLFAVKNAPISSAMGRRKTQNIAATEADIAVLCDVSCMTHINGLLTRQGQHCRAVHIAQLLTNEVEVVERPAAEKRAEPVDKTPPSRRWQDARG